MGGSTFGTTALGKTAEEAFRDAVDQALYDNGHAGYTGTIAEKNEFTMCSREPMTAKDAAAFADKLIHDFDPRIDDKWGPAGCVEVSDHPEAKDGLRAFYFFGRASS